MCGIVGAVQVVPGSYVDVEAIRRCTRSLAHRGPDAEGIVDQPEFAFGHRRLSVIDTSASANQPMVNAGGDTFVTYNGEIYNFRELRQELVAAGRPFRTGSDTEVILQAYAEWGPRCVERFLGMFALGLYDRRLGRFLLARDRLGVKPVYVRRQGGLLLFASEPKALLSYPGVPRTLNRGAVSCFLSYRHVLGTETYFDGIEQLPPAHLLQVRDGQLTQSRYWDIDLAQPPHRTTTAQRGQLKTLIGDAVRRRMVSDVPIGAFLSGGLDSSIIVCEMARMGQPITTFTASFEGDAYDESRYAALVARRFRTDHHHIRLEAQHYLDHTRALIRIKDQPLGMHNEVAMYLLARELRRHVTVVLCGEGADELFDGYGRIFRAPFDFARARLLAQLRQGWRGRQSDPPAPLDYFLNRYSYFPWNEKAGLYTDEMRAAAAGDERYRAIFARRFAQAAHRSFHDQIALVFETLHLPGLLQMLDTTTMAVGVEARVPFVDHRLVQEAADLAESEKLRWRSPAHFVAALAKPAERYSEVHDMNKVILRRLYADELPAEVLNRRKMGFPVPLGQWFSGAQRHYVRTQLLRDGARIHDVFDAGRLRSWFDAARGGDDARFGRQVWLMLNLEFWLEEYF